MFRGKKLNISLGFFIYLFFFFNCYLSAPRPTLNKYWGGSVIHWMPFIEFLHIWPEGHWEPRNNVGYLSQAEHLVRLESGTFHFWLQPLNTLGHSPHYFKVLKDIRPNAIHYFIIKIPNKIEILQITLNHSPGTEFKKFIKLCKGYTNFSDWYTFIIRQSIKI